MSGVLTGDDSEVTMVGSGFEVVGRVETGSADQDRYAVISLPLGFAVIVADGAGGTGGGREAAEGLIACLRSAFDSGRIAEPAALVAELVTADSLLEPVGQTTGVVVVLEGSRVYGASVGDSGAWWITSDRFKDLTVAQARKPLLGSGAAQPTVFDEVVADGTLLVATDGLLKYAPGRRICELARGQVLAAAAQDLIGSVRLRSGGLQDDVAVVLARRSEHR